MFDKTNAHQAKNEIHLDIVLNGQTAFKATVFVKYGERISDLLNDSRNFIPMRRDDGVNMIIAKSSIISCAELEVLTNDEQELQDEEPNTEEQHDEESTAEQPKDEQPGEEEPKDEQPGEEEPKSENPGENEGPGEEEPKKEEAFTRAKRGRFDPYDVLRIKPDADIEEVRRAYKARIKGVHPDTLAALDVDDEIYQAALRATQRINIAYKQILDERETRAA